MNEAVQKDLIFIDLDEHSKEDIIHHLAKEAEYKKVVLSADEYAKAVFEREEEISTAIGYDLAIPHGKSETIQYPFMIFARLKNPVQWNEENKVKMIFMLGIPKEGGEKMHLKMLASISRKLMHEDFRLRLLEEDNTETIYELLNNIDL